VSKLLAHQHFTFPYANRLSKPARHGLGYIGI
jgi:hypothetical protein